MVSHFYSPYFPHVDFLYTDFCIHIFRIAVLHFVKHLHLQMNAERNEKKMRENMRKKCKRRCGIFLIVFPMKEVRKKDGWWFLYGLYLQRISTKGIGNGMRKEMERNNKKFFKFLFAFSKRLVILLLLIDSKGSAIIPRCRDFIKLC